MAALAQSGVVIIQFGGEGQLLSLYHFFVTNRCSSQSSLSSGMKLSRERAGEDSSSDFWMPDGSEGKTKA